MIRVHEVVHWSTGQRTYAYRLRDHEHLDAYLDALMADWPGTYVRDDHDTRHHERIVRLYDQRGCFVAIMASSERHHDQCACCRDHYDPDAGMGCNGFDRIDTHRRNAA